jgi:hypothetical protein
MLRELYYTVKPIIPRKLQIEARRAYARWLIYKNGHKWPIDPDAGKKPEGWPGWPDGKRFALVLTHDADTARGQERCLDVMELEKSLGFRSAFNFVPRRYDVSPEVRNTLTENGFEVGVHGLYHDGKYFESRTGFAKRAVHINRYIREWKAAGFRAPSMLHNLEWFHDLDIQYDASTFDTDPFEPQPDGVRTIFPFFVQNGGPDTGYVELPYTLPQDFLLFVLLKQDGIDIWKEKLKWIAEHGGMALLITHPDYMVFNGRTEHVDEYPSENYRTFLEYVKSTYEGQYWHALPRDVARHVSSWRKTRPDTQGKDKP